MGSGASLTRSLFLGLANHSFAGAPAVMSAFFSALAASSVGFGGQPGVKSGHTSPLQVSLVTWRSSNTMPGEGTA